MDFKHRSHAELYIVLSSLGLLSGDWTQTARPSEGKRGTAMARVQVRGEKGLN